MKLGFNPAEYQTNGFYYERSDLSQIVVTFFNGEKDIGKTERKMSWDELYEFIKKAPKFKSKADRKAFKLASFGDHRTNKALRNNENVIDVYGVEIDYDGKGESLIPIEEAARRLEKAGLEAILYSSWSADPENGEHRWRAILPLSKPVKPAVRVEMVERLNHIFEGGIDQLASFTLSQCFYYGNNGKNYSVQRVHGKPLDVAGRFLPRLPKQGAKKTVDESGHEVKLPSDERVSEAIRQIYSNEHYYEPALSLAGVFYNRGMSREGAIAMVKAILEAHPKPNADIASYIAGADNYLTTLKREEVDAKTQWVEHDYDQSKVHIEEYLFDRFIGEGLFIVAGATGVGKTNALVTLCSRVTGFVGSDGDFLVPYFKRKVIYITEHASQVVNILHALSQHTDARIASSEFKDWFHIYNSKRLAPEVVAAQIRDLIQEMIVYQDTPAGRLPVMPLVVFDTFAASFDLDDENNSSAVGRCIVGVKEVANEFECHMIISAHTSKANKRAKVNDLSVVGSGSFENNAMIVGYIFKEDDASDSPYRYLRLSKHRYQPLFNEIRFTSSLHNAIGVNKAGLPVETTYMHLTVEESSESGRANQKALAKELDDSERLINVIRELNSDGEPVSQTSLEKMQLGIGGLRTLLKRLKESGRLREEEFPVEMRKNGNQTKTLVVVETWE
jgi:RecA-family ATPase